MPQKQLRDLQRRWKIMPFPEGKKKMKEVSLNYELRSETGIYYLNKVME